MLASQPVPRLQSGPQGVAEVGSVQGNHECIAVRHYTAPGGIRTQSRLGLWQTLALLLSSSRTHAKGKLALRFQGQVIHTIALFLPGPGGGVAAATTAAMDKDQQQQQQHSAHKCEKDHKGSDVPFRLEELPAPQPPQYFLCSGLQLLPQLLIRKPHLSGALPSRAQPLLQRSWLPRMWWRLAPTRAS